MRILAFGDSIVYGRDAPSGGWVQRLIGDDIEAIVEGVVGQHTATYNLGVGGDTIRDVVKRFELETKSRIAGDRGLAFVFGVGINDAKVVDGKPVTTLKRYIKDLRALVTLARHYSDRLLFIGLLPVDIESPYVKSYWTTGRIKEFETELRAFAAAESIAFVPLFELFTERMTEEQLFTDGLHPNDDGHALIYETVKPTLASILQP